MEITDLVEKNSTLLRLGLHLEFNDARHRVAAHLQRNIDRSEYKNSFLIFLSFSTQLQLNFIILKTFIFKKKKKKKITPQSGNYFERNL